MSITKPILATLLGLCLAAPLAADDKVVAELKQKLATLVPGQTPDKIAPSPVAGLYQVRYGTQVFYLSDDGRYVIEGSLLDLTSRRNLTEEAKSGARKDVLDTMGEDKMIVFGPETAKHTITVFTDVDCPYCVKLHNEMEAYNKAGIRVRYLLYPRAGVGSPSYQTSVSVWCAEDRQEALTRAKNRKPIEQKTCENPVIEHLQLGQAVGVSGTPAILLDDGELVPGYRPAADLGPMLDQRAAARGDLPEHAKR
jgi:thiol:disulfide interchange protein DsbC